MSAQPNAMERGERFSSLDDAILASLDGWQSTIWTALPGFIVDYDPERQTASVQPAIQARKRNPDLTWEFVNLPVCPDVPVEFPNGGGYSLTFPIAAGDECVLEFQSRCIDAWWYYGLGDPQRPQVQAEMRMHNLSDAICRVGPRSLPRALPAVSTDSVQLRTEDGDAYIEIKGTTVNIVTPSDVNVTAGGSAVVTVGGNASIIAAGIATIQATSILLQHTGAALKKLVNESFIAFFNSHVHSTGAGNTGVPTIAAGAGQETTVTKAE